MGLSVRKLQWSIFRPVFGSSGINAEYGRGWEQKLDYTTGRTYYVDHKHQITTWNPPQLQHTLPIHPPPYGCEPGNYHQSIYTPQPVLPTGQYQGQLAQTQVQVPISPVLSLSHSSRVPQMADMGKLIISEKEYPQLEMTKEQLLVPGPAESQILELGKRSPPNSRSKSPDGGVSSPDGIQEEKPFVSEVRSLSVLPTQVTTVSTIGHPDEEWQCPNCTLINHRTSKSCDACQTSFNMSSSQPSVQISNVSSSYPITKAQISSKISSSYPSPNGQFSRERSPRLEDDNIGRGAKTQEWVCPYESCNGVFFDLFLYDEHMTLHQGEEQVSRSPMEDSGSSRSPGGYVGQYMCYVNHLVQTRRISPVKAVQILELMEKNLDKPDTETRTKGITSGLKSFSLNTKSIVSKQVDHYSTSYGDAGWGCGYRNFQMVCSYLMQIPAFKKCLFGGCGFIPGVPKIQEWLEKCWAAGFDGSHFKGKIVNTMGKIGTNDVASLFRFFGVKMEIYDFSSIPLPEAVIRAQRGPNIRYFEPNSKLVYWIWDYFYRKSKEGAKFRPPLYLQYSGHSLTVVGAQRNSSGEIHIYYLDPAREGYRLKEGIKFSDLSCVRFPLAEFTHEHYQIGCITSDKIVKGKEKDQLIAMDFVMEQLS
eukprot:TRINITY_DN13319_c0_g1_i2.p1 TRINITY_DN13319_c0_g1~~TRINITY_DN13319_c0_g1_i2.p1  ORF type:complete len:646 (+),score=100.89 TRINITY_DN13319_c0_g1_i2:861-2798(+)